MIGERWMRWTFAEAGTKTVSKLLQKVVGNVSTTLAHTFFATLVIGLVQTISGLIVCRVGKKPIFRDGTGILGSCLFGFFAVVSSVLSFSVFLLGGEVGINTFIITLSIIPGALIDRFFFGKQLSGREWFGISVAIFAGYSVLGWPSPATAMKLPLWVWLSFGIAVSVAINQGITQKVKKVDPFFKNFWGGLTTIVLSLAAVTVLGSFNLFADFSKPMRNLWLVSIVIGAIVVGMWSFNLLSYKGGASIALKKLVMNGAYLITAMLAGVWLFGESLTISKLVGIGLFVIAFALMDRTTWGFITRKLLA
ncbi:MAG: DMT family transporter [Candidatus Harrisonbacteria bacterium]|nr:DMT family transporter [Candidatus Harrisonbacteria bacterium]